VSPDGTQIAFYNLGDTQEDLFVGTRDGGMRRVTDDAARDRGPVFTPDGRSLVFYSNRDGNWAVWSIGVDGSNLRRVAGEAPGAVYAYLSPQGDTVAFVDIPGRAVYTTPLGGGKAPTLLPGTLVDGKYFTVTDWSADGARLAGILTSGNSGRPSGVGYYDLAARTTTALNGDEAYAVKWLKDSRRVVYFAADGTALVVADSVSGARTIVDVRLPAPAVINELFAFSPDNRTIYYGGLRAEADIWIVERR
jgi:Tol biopolymer transport system component